MKQHHVFILCLALLSSACFFLSGAAHASDFSFSVGFDYWKPDWDYTVSGKSNFDASSTTDGMFGPNIRIGYRAFYAGISYLTGDFDFDLSNTDNDTGNRDDYTYFAGYNFLNYFTARIYYEDFNFKHNFDSQSGITQDQTGLGFGIGAFYPFADTGFFVLGSASYTPFGNLKYKLHFSDNHESEDGDATKYTFDGGIGYYFNFPLSLTVGYRYSKTDTDDDFMDNEFKGVTFSASYTF